MTLLEKPGVQNFDFNVFGAQARLVECLLYTKRRTQRTFSINVQQQTAQQTDEPRTLVASENLAPWGMEKDGLCYRTNEICIDEQL